MKITVQTLDRDHPEITADAIKLVVGGRVIINLPHGRLVLDALEADHYCFRLEAAEVVSEAIAGARADEIDEDRPEANAGNVIYACGRNTHVSDYVIDIGNSSIMLHMAPGIRIAQPTDTSAGNTIQIDSAPNENLPPSHN